MKGPCHLNIFSEVHFHIIHPSSSTKSPHPKITTTITKTSVKEAHQQPWRHISLFYKWTTILLHTQSPWNTTLHSWEKRGSYYYFWMFLKESSWDERVFLFYANIIKRCVYWKHPQETWWIPAAVPSQSSFLCKHLFCPPSLSPHWHSLTTLTSSAWAPVCVFFSSHFIIEDVCF